MWFLDCAVSRRSALASALVAACASPTPAAFATKYDGPPTLYNTPSGILFYDTEFGDDIPKTMKLSAVLAQDPVAAPVDTNPTGTKIILSA